MSVEEIAEWIAEFKQIYAEQNKIYLHDDCEFYNGLYLIGPPGQVRPLYPFMFNNADDPDSTKDDHRLIMDIDDGVFQTDWKPIPMQLNMYRTFHELCKSYWRPDLPLELFRPCR